MSDEKQMWVLGRLRAALDVVTAEPALPLDREGFAGILEEAIAFLAPPGPCDARKVFAFWLGEIHPDPKVHYRFTDRRRKKVKARIVEGFTVQELEEAITGCKLTPHNMGDNERKQPFNDLELICRNPENVERFRDTARRLAGPSAPEDLQFADWVSIRNQLRYSYSANTFTQWLVPLTALGGKDSTLYLTGPARVCTWVERHYLGGIREAVREHSPYEEVSLIPVPPSTKIGHAN